MSGYVTVMITDACNLKCKHCYKTQKNTRCNIEKAKEFIIAEKPLAVVLFGGEPLLETNLDIVEELINFCNTRGAKCFVSSNLTFDLTDRHIKIIKQLADINTSFNINRWTSANQFEKWLENGIKLKSIKDVSCACTLDRDLISESPERMHNLFQTFPFLQFCFEPYIGLDKAKNEDIDNWLCKYYEISKNDYVLDFLFQSIIAKFYGKNISARFDPKCWKISKVLHTDGHITCCPISQVDITNGREILNNLYKPKEQCLNCKWFKYCEGICPLMRDDKDYCHGYPKLYELIKKDVDAGLYNNMFKWQTNI